MHTYKRKECADHSGRHIIHESLLFYRRTTLLSISSARHMAWMMDLCCFCFFACGITSNASTLGCFFHCNLHRPYISHDSGDENALCFSSIAVCCPIVGSIALFSWTRLTWKWQIICQLKVQSDIYEYLDFEWNCSSRNEIYNFFTTFWKF